jgi:SpoVK/Ycf46/Vps4 family AAA+-type ATPase
MASAWGIKFGVSTLPISLFSSTEPLWSAKALVLSLLGAFAISRLSEVDWDETIFDSLVLPADKKSFVRALIKSRGLNTNCRFDDIVRDKGKGLVCLFSGPPGVGKTLTAEAVAEVAHRPLYVLTSGELGDNPDSVQNQLSNILELAEEWKAVLLLDEADVFLVERDNVNLTRNAITSIFLRKLEYYQGILLLTTNRLSSIDPAFQSRVHFCFNYQPLDSEGRVHVWSTFLKRAESMSVIPVQISDNERRRLAEENLNGRQIKNIVTISRAYATEENIPMTMEVIHLAIAFSKWSVV